MSYCTLVSGRRRDIIDILLIELRVRISQELVPSAKARRLGLRARESSHLPDVWRHYILTLRHRACR